MHQFLFTLAALLARILGVSPFVPGQTTPADKPAKTLVRASLFGPDKLWTIHLHIGVKEWQAMQPKGGGGFMGKFPFPKKDDAAPKKEAPKGSDAPADVHKSKLFGMEFPYVKADLEFEGQRVKDVGLRFKGNSSYMMSAQGIRRPFKVDVNHYVEDQKVYGLGGLNLANNALDPTRIREALAYLVFDAAGVPAPRTAFVKLYLTVPGAYNRTYAGVYTLIEPVDKAFLRRHFQSDKGMLLKPEKIQGLPYLGENWAAYKDRYNPKREPTPDQAKRLIEFTKLVNRTDSATFQKKIAAYLDVDGFLRFMAVNSLIANVDSFFGLGHNYFLYLNPKTDRFHFMPWDLDLSFGNFGMAGGEQTEWSIAQPALGKNRLVERVLAIKEYNQAYRDHLKQLTDTVFAPKKMRGAIAILEQTVKEAEPFRKGFGFGPGGKKSDLREFVTKRADSVIAQLAGTSPGKTLTMNFGPGFGGKGPKGK